ncbi:MULTISPECIES: efflux RND transporter permease subunit [Anaerotruncus]|uniref:efflux RND transporter permease subunit n=1 Tax=Anaerotruncus TaxID=244127 RepID=UPI002084267A|nr:efflux RND transporter permease subunit [Anaerotruncus massiliensis (ex Togo et al. 2019)]GKH47611.1 multidrug ABC transporter [Oscillospiraceae bacterium]
MNLTKLAIRRPVSMFIVVLALVVFGFSAMLGAPLELMPDMEMPAMIILTIYPGAGPEEVNDLVTSVIEDSAASLSGVKNVTSQSKENMSLVMLEMDYGANMDVAHMDLQEKLDMYKSTLPDDAQTPTIIEVSMDMMPSIVLSANATGDVDLLRLIDDDVKPEFEKLSGVATADVMGGQKDYISVTLNEERLKQYKLDMNTIIGFVGAADFSIPAGSVDRGDQELSLRGGVSYNTVESLKNIPITLPTGQVIHLSDVANVYQGTEEAGSISRYNGHETVMISITKRQSAGTVDVSRAVIDTMNKINDSNIGVEMSVINDSSEQILASIKTVIQTLIGAVILCMIVLFLFFRDWRASLIVGSSIPVSVLTTLILMNMMGFSFNVVSLGGLIIGVGMMVDNSIVVLESCFQRQERQLTHREAALEGAKFVTSSIIASTITTIVVFLPISILKGLSGQMFRQLGFTIIFSLTASLISALTIVPLMFCRLKPVEREGRFGLWLKKVEVSYGGFLKKTFRHKALVVIVSVVLLVVSVGMVFFIPMQLMPDIDQGSISISVDTKPGLKLAEVDRILTGLETMVAECPDVERYSLSSGGSSMLSSGGGGSISVYLRGDREKSTKEWVDIWRAQTANTVGYDVDVSASSMMSMMGGGSSVDVNIQGNDLDTLRGVSRQIEEQLRGRGEVVRVTSTVSSGDPQAEIKVDPIKATAVGLTPKQVIGTVYNIMEGNSPDTLRVNGQEYDIRIEYPKDRYQTVADLSGLMLTAPGGRQVPLLDIATIEYSNAPLQIDRQNNQYIVTVSGQLTTAAERNAAKITQEVTKSVEGILPTGVSIATSDMMESMNEEFSALGGAILTAILLVFMVMAMQFESARFSIIVMICVPFSLIGSFGLMLLSGVTMSMPSLMGFLMLVGTVVNNGILFIDTANSYRGSMDAETALIYAGRSRLRPILMTTLTTVLSMLPMALAIGESAEAMQGMAIVIIGGLTASTVLTLLLLPTFYLLFRGKPRKNNDTDPEAALKPPASDLSPEELSQF